MNSDQIASAVRGILKWLGGALAAHGAAKAAQVVNMPDVIELVIGLVTTIVGFVMSHKWHADDSQPGGTLSGTVTKVGAIVLLCGMALGMVGCVGGNARLEQGGAYAPVDFVVSTNSAGIISTNVVELQQADFALFEADAAFNTAASAVQAVFRLERDNRALLWSISPKIKGELDTLRPAAWKAITEYTVARAAYLANPIPANLTPMETLTSQIEAILAAAQAAMQTPLQNVISK